MTKFKYIESFSTEKVRLSIQKRPFWRIYTHAFTCTHIVLDVSGLPSFISNFHVDCIHTLAFPHIITYNISSLLY
jgi:hypothetical protein